MKLLVQPGDGVKPLVAAIKKAKKSVQIVIFRFDRVEIEKSLEDAVKRGVAVEALIAFTNRGGEKNLRKLETRFLEHGVTVSRTSDDLVRYHGKMMVVDGKQLYLLAFNWTRIDIEASRSFAIITGDRELVREAISLFEADSKRRKYKAGSERFLVSPLNARRQLADFIKGAKKELLVYDVKITDREMIRLLEERARDGVEVRIIGKIAQRSSQISVRKLAKLRLHARSIVRDGKDVFVGSQSLRELELDQRREIGIVVRDPEIAKQIARVFAEDWKSGAAVNSEVDDVAKPPSAKVAKKVAKSVTRDLPPVAPVVADAVKQVLRAEEISIDQDEIEETVKTAVKQAVKHAVREVVQDAVEQQREPEA